MARAELLVGADLGDAGFGVTSNSRQDIPVGTVFTLLLQRSGDQEVGMPLSVRLVLIGVTWFRNELDAIPFGHNASVRFSGDGLDQVKARLPEKGRGEHLVLVSDL